MARRQYRARNEPGNWQNWVLTGREGRESSKYLSQEGVVWESRGRQSRWDTAVVTEREAMGSNRQRRAGQQRTSDAICIDVIRRKGRDKR